MAEHSENHGHGHGDVQVEESGLPNLGILAFVVVTAVIFFGSAAVLPTVFYRITDQMTARLAGSGSSSDLATLRAQETERLTTYGYVDKDKQIAHIPIDVAMQKVVEDAAK